MAGRLPVLAVGGVVIGGGTALHVALIRRAKDPGRGRWSLPGGRLEPDERLADALVRELREEIGLDVKVGPVADVVEIPGDPTYVVVDYICRPRPDDADLPRLTPGDDAEEAVWASLSQLDQFDLTPAVRRVIARAFASHATASSCNEPPSTE